MATVPITTPSKEHLNTTVTKRRRACTHCGSDEIYRQRPRGIIERHVARAFNFAPYWCAACDRRCYLRVSSKQKS